MKLFRSCMVVLSCVLLMIFSGTTYAHLRMWWVNDRLFQVAEQLGYTPDALLQHRVNSHDIAPPMNTYCGAHLYFTTTLSHAEFRKRVVQALPETSGQDWPEPVYLSLPGLRINIEEVASYYWFSGESRADISLTFNDLTNVGAPVDYKGLPVTGNIVELYKDGGSVPVWTCPTRTTEITPPPANGTYLEKL